MKNRIFAACMFILLTISASCAFSQSIKEFSLRRSKVFEQMAPKSVMIFRTPQSSGMFDYSRRGGYFYYLTGIDEPGCTLILFSKDFKSPTRFSAQAPAVLFINSINADRISWDAQTLGVEGAKAKYGFEDVRPADEAMEYIGKLLVQNFSLLYMDVQKSNSIYASLSDDEQILRKAKDHGANFEIQSPAGILRPFLAVKSPEEIDLVRKSVSITAEAQKEVMRSLKSGMYEYQVDAIIRFVFSIYGSQSVSFPSIVGSGENAVVLHWMENSRKMEDGDIVVVDCGTEKDMYCADISRTYPVSGKFTKRQKEIYEIVLAANEAAINKIGPGVRMSVVSDAADSVLANGMLRIGLIKDKADFKRYYYHSLSHHIGLKGAFGNSAGDILLPGMIITIEPGIYVKEERIGVRIEDDVLVTETGFDILSKDAPKKVIEVENGMKEEGMKVTTKVF